MSKITVPFHIPTKEIKNRVISRIILEETKDMKKELVVQVGVSWPCYPESGSETLTNFRLESFIEIMTDKMIRPKRFQITEIDDEE